MEDIAIDISGLGKRYLIPEQQQAYLTLRESLQHACTAPIKRLRRLAGRSQGPAPSTHREVWALRDIDLSVRHGEVLGVIGRNGSGKSTLLKILSRITAPSVGRARIRGRVGSLLEVGTGFHYELSGRDNVFLAGAMLGMRRAEIQRKFDEIVAFSQIGQFLDTPVKRYSSGMYMRLAFSVAAHLQSEILLVDEVLAVGDFDFQQKCIDKMRELTRTGRTVLFVSHSMGSVETLCDRAILLNRGTLEAIGTPAEVIRQYLPPQDTTKTGQTTWTDPVSAPGNETVSLQSVSVHDSDGKVVNELDLEDEVCIRIGYWNHKPGVSYRLQVMLRDQDGTWVLAAQNQHALSEYNDPWSHRPYPVGLFESHCVIPGNLLNDHEYSVTVEISSFNDKTGVSTLRRENVLTFKMRDPSASDPAKALAFVGPVRPRLSWRTDLKKAA